MGTWMHGRDVMERRRWAQHMGTDMMLRDACMNE